MKQYTVDAFTQDVFHGNPAAVCIADAWPEDGLMLAIAKENNLSETAFAVKQADGSYRLRWFTPGGEIDLCGHATLATAFVLFRDYISEAQQVVFHTLSGELVVDKQDDLLAMTFPAYTLTEVAVSPAITAALGHTPTAAYMGRDLLCVFEDESVVRAMQPDMVQTAALDGLLVHATAPGADSDCVSRTFAPKLGVAEDPVCGSGHCHIVPYWAGRLGKTVSPLIRHPSAAVRCTAPSTPIR
ncbi:PhzF family phenazine biosynthesis protein [Neisseria sp. HSC-16F19]|nr:PhzF family phenazine biosynthesis protein [Neisseria sp. HSC-16F19]MCP2041519.1 PhzF family phenazine biosynthesis protein [Neisseria sp. HSC-16F19]